MCGQWVLLCPLPSHILGVVLYEIFQITKPYYSIINHSEVIIQVCENGYRLERPTKIPIPDELWAVMLQCWNQNPKERPTMEQLHAALVVLSNDLDPDITLNVVNPIAEDGNYTDSADSNDPYKRTPAKANQRYERSNLNLANAFKD